MDEPAHATTHPTPLRSRTGLGRPYGAEVVAAVRELAETTSLRFGEIAERTGVGEASVGRWARRSGWRRPGAGQAYGDRVAETCAHVACSPRRRPYGPADHEAARALIEGSRIGLERIGLELGISAATLFRWQWRFGWRRPASSDGPGPKSYRYRSRGRPYAADAVGIARQLVTGTLLSQKRIAAQAGVSQATVSNWIARRGWVRPPAKPWSHRFAAARRTGPLTQEGDRRGQPYAPFVRRDARNLWELTRLSTALIGARLGVSAATVARWARTEAWVRPRGRAGARQLRGLFGSQRARG